MIDPLKKKGIQLLCGFFKKNPVNWGRACVSPCLEGPFFLRIG